MWLIGKKIYVKKIRNEQRFSYFEEITFYKFRIIKLFIFVISKFLLKYNIDI